MIRYVAQEAPSCLSPLLAKQEGGREFEFDIGTLYSEFPVIFKRAHGYVVNNRFRACQSVSQIS